MTARTAAEKQRDTETRLKSVERKLALFGRRAKNPARELKEWAAVGGPTAYNSAYRNTWAKLLDSGGTLKAVADGVTIGETGVYEVVGMQRGNGTGVPDATAQVAVALNGDTATLLARTDGILTYDHSKASNDFSNTRYIGKLNAGEKVTLGTGSSNSGKFRYSSATTDGMMTVRRIS